MAAWFGGSTEGCNDVSIYSSVYEKGHWSSPQLLAEGADDSGNRLPCWNPVLFKSKNGRLYLFYKVGENPREWRGMVKISADNGITWEPERELPPGFLGPIRNKPIPLSSGEILCPSSTEGPNGKWKVHIEIVNDDLMCWKNIPVDPSGGFDVIQPTILVHNDRVLQILCRSKQNCIVQSWSRDDGQSWEALSCLSLSNPNSGIDAVTLSDGRFLLVYNPLRQGEDWSSGRNILKVALSADGVAWRDILTLEDHADGEYSYPAVIQAGDGKIHITYTADRMNIKHAVLELDCRRTTISNN
ncbi:MAG: sialidase family protein [Acidobacteriota bacterium]|nr:sialidase family protein [Acidobacteriota bacterium]